MTSGAPFNTGGITYFPTSVIVKDYIWDSITNIVEANVSYTGVYLGLDNLGIKKIYKLGADDELKYLSITANPITTLVDFNFPKNLLIFSAQGIFITNLNGVNFNDKLEYLFLSGCRITTLLGAILPEQLKELGLQYNLIYDYSIMEEWANSLSVFFNNNYWDFSNNPSTPSGNFSNILNTKNISVQYSIIPSD